MITTRKNLNYSKACQPYQKVIEEAFLKVEECLVRFSHQEVGLNFKFDHWVLICNCIAKVMERLVKKYEQKYRKAREEMDKWDALQLRLLKQFRNAAAIIERLEVLGDKENYGVLKFFSHIAKELPAKQVESLEIIFISMRSTLDEFNKVVKSLKKIWQDGCHLLKGETQQPTLQQMQMRVGLRPSLSDCLDGLKAIYEMHLSEYLLKVPIVSALTYDSRPGDVAALQAVLADQPNIPTNEVQLIFNIIFAEEIS